MERSTLEFPVEHILFPKKNGQFLHINPGDLYPEGGLLVVFVTVPASRDFNISAAHRHVCRRWNYKKEDKLDVENLANTSQTNNLTMLHSTTVHNVNNVVLKASLH